METKEVLETKEVKTLAKKPATKKAETKTEKEVKAPAAKKVKTAKAGQAKASLGTGRRKTSVARVRVIPGTGKIEINGLSLEEYFRLPTLQQIVKQPLVLTATEKKVDVLVNVYGGGLSGQAGAVRHGIARGLVKENEALKAELKKAGFLTRDAREKERRKYGLKKARKAPQFSKR